MNGGGSGDGETLRRQFDHFEFRLKIWLRLSLDSVVIQYSSIQI